MYKILTYSLLCAVGFIWLFPNATKTKSTKHIHIGMPTDMDELIKAREQLMLADPATGKIPDNIRAREIQFYNDNFGPISNKPTRDQQPWYNAGPYNVGGRTRAMALDVTNEAIIIAGSVSGSLYRSTDTGKTWMQTSNLNGYLGVISVAQDKRPGKQNIWYAVTGEPSGNSASGGGAYYFGDGMFKSTDSGKSWQPIASTATGVPNAFTIPYQVSWKVATHPAMDSDIVFVATYGTIRRSNNGGNTFTQVLGDFNGASPYYTDVVVTKDGIVYATLSSDGNGAGFWRSADKGLTWTNITPATFGLHERTVMGLDPTTNDTSIYFFSYLPDSTNTWGTITSNYKGAPEWISLMRYTYIQGNGADTNGIWQNLSNNLPNNANVIGGGSFDKLNCQGGYDMVITVQPITGYVFIAGTNIFRSTDKFATPNNFTQIGGYMPGTSLPYFKIYTNHHPDNHDMVFSPTDTNKLFSASDGGIRLTYQANNPKVAGNNMPVTWLNRNYGYITSQLYSVSLDPTPGSNWLIGGFQDNGNFLTTDFTNPTYNWDMPFNGDGAYNYIAPNRDFFVMSIQEGVMAKFNLDATGKVISYNRIDPIGPKKDDYQFINPFAVDPNNKDILYLPAGKRLYRQDQLSTLPLSGNWDTISTGWFKFIDTLPIGNNANGVPSSITCIAVSKSPANIVYVGTDNKEIFRIENANTNSPIIKKITKNFIGNYISSIAVDPNNGKNILISCSNYSNGVRLFYSKTGGDTILYAMGNLRAATSNYSGASPSMRAVHIETMPNGKTKYFVGTSVGLFSTDSLKPNSVVGKDSTVWVPEGANTIGTLVVNHITGKYDGTVAVSTHGGGAFYSKQYYPVSINTSNEFTTNLNIYPNPATNTLNINMQVPTYGNYHIYLCNVLGKIIIDKGIQLLSQGNTTFAIGTSSIPNGTYWVVVENSKGAKESRQVWVNNK